VQRRAIGLVIVSVCLILVAMLSLLVFYAARGSYVSGTSERVESDSFKPSMWRPEWIDLDNNRIADNLDQEIADRLSNHTSQEYVDVTVMLKSPPTANDANTFAACGGYLTTSPWTEAVYGFGGTIPYGEIDNFTRQCPDALLVEKEAICNETVAYAAEQAGARNYVWNTVGLQGEPNSSIALLDTGIDPTHPDFSPGFGDQNFSEKIVGWNDQINTTTSPYDDNGHGTDVAGLAAGNGFFSTDASGNAIGTWGSNLGSVSSTGAYLISGMMVNKTGTITIKVKWATTGTATLSALPLYYGGKTLNTGSWTQLASVSTPSQNTWYTLTYNVATTPSGGYDMYHVLMALTAGTGNLYVVFTMSWPYTPPADGFSAWTGIAPQAKLVGVKVLDSTGSGTSTELINGINWIITNRMTYHITVASMSLGFTSEAAAVDSAVVNLVNSGVTTVVAAGNNGSGGNYVYSPASVDEVITVAAMNQFDNIASYSSQGGTSRYNGQTVKPDITAPGGSFYAMPLFSADSNYNDAEGEWPDVQANDSAPMQGTSMAAPIVAGAANIVIQAMGGYAMWNWTRSQALLPKMILLMTATETYPNLREGGTTSTSPTLDRGGKDPQEGYGRLNLDAAVNAVLNTYTVGTTVTATLGTPPNPNNISVLGQKLAWASNIQLASGLTYNFTLDVPTGADYDLYLYNSTGTTYGEPSIVAKSTNATTGGIEQFWIKAPYTGTYYVVVKTATEATGNGTFTLTSSGPVYVTFGQTGVSSDFTGTVLTVDGTNYSVNSLPVSFWYNNGSSHTFAYQAPLQVATNQKQYVWNSTSGLSSSESGTIIVSSNASVTGNYKTQFYVTFGQTGVGSDLTGTMLTIDGTNHTVNDLPISFWYDNGSNHTFAYQSPLVVTAGQKQYVWLSTSGLSTLQSGSITISGNGSITGIYKTQFWIQVNSSHDTPTASQWVDSGSNFTASVTSPTEIVAGSLRWVCTGFNIDGGSLIPGTIYTFTSASMNHTIIFDWKEQFWTVFSQLGADSDFTGTIITIDATNYSVSALPASFWYDSGSNHTFAYQSPLIVEANQKQYLWTTTSGLSTSQSGSIIVSGNGTVTSNYKTQWWISVTSAQDTPTASAWVDNSGSFVASVTSPTEVVAGDHQWVSTGFSVDEGSSQAGTSYTFSNVQTAHSIVFNWKEQFWIQVNSTHDLPTTPQWVDQGSGLTVSVNSLADDDGLGTRYRCTGYTLDSNPQVTDGSTTYTFTSVQNSHNVTFNWVAQYRLVVNSDHDSPSPSGTNWYDAGTSLTASVTSPADQVGGTRYRCTGWSGTGSAPASGTDTSLSFIVAQPSNVAWNWIVQYLVTFGQTGVGADFTGTVVTVDGANYGVSGASFWWDSQSTHSFLFQSPLVVNANQKRYIWGTSTGLSTEQDDNSFSVNSSGSVTGSYLTQWYVTFDQTDINPDFTGNIAVIDGTNYNVGDLPASFWYYDGSNHTFAYQSLLVVTAGQKQYVWLSTSGLSTLQSSSITISGNGEVTGNYKTQWWIVVSSVHDTATASVWVDDAANFTASVTSPTEVVAGDHQWVCTGFSVNGGAPVAGTSYTFDSVQATQAIVFNWKEQFWIQVNSAHDSPTVSQWVDQGNDFTASISSPADIVLNDHQFVCTGFSVDGGSSILGTSYTFTSLEAAHSIVFSWEEQFWIQVNSLHDSPTASQWVDQAGNLVVSVVSPADDDGLGTRYRCTGYTLDSNPQVTDGSTSYVFGNVQSSHAVTFNWVAQYRLTVASAYDSPSPSGTSWYDSGTLITVSVTSPVDQVGGTRYRCTGWTGTGSVPASGTGTSMTLTITQPSNVTWNWIVQYLVTFGQSGIGADFTGTAVTIDGVDYNVSVLPVSFWYDNGSSHSFAYEYSLVVTAEQEQYAWNSTTGLSLLQVDTIIISDSGTVTGNYLTQFYATFSQTGVRADFTGTVVTIDGVNYTVSTLPASFWWDNGSTHTFAFDSSPVVSGAKQYNWTSTTGLSSEQSGSITLSGSGSVVANYSWIILEGPFYAQFDGVSPPIEYWVFFEPALSHTIRLTN
jgi:subtilisin family serine protease